ncbi:hypothetical protein DB88DRAFT_507625 [Papiliotrema laurentii]|uniref:DUF7918 domain-containing protein n=1 Tax=Papiliotrema laurentii TaxID=5418 RepID=A0AAD9L8V1_PAPLA|nr:hypothetical protein DB88DRAFT_507625 [Papiliotrema laurentii]
MAGSFSHLTDSSDPTFIPSTLLDCITARQRDELRSQRMKADEDSPFAGLEVCSSSWLSTYGEVYLETLDGQRLNEFEIPEEDAGKEQDIERAGRVKRCYLECPEDLSKSFRIKVRSDRSIFGPSRRSEDIQIAFFLDGRWVKATAVWAILPFEVACERMFSCEGGLYKEHALKFTQATTIEPSATSSQASKQKSVGQIEVTFDFGFAELTGGSGSPLVVDPVVGPLNEKIQKGAADRVISGSEGKPWTHTMQSYTFDYDDPVQRPGYTMIFKYHSRQMLMAKEIIEPPAPAPTKLGRSDIESSRKDSTIAETEKRFQALEAEVARLREQVGKQRERDRSPSTGPSHKRKKGNVVGNIIDLTEDDD